MFTVALVLFVVAIANAVSTSPPRKNSATTKTAAMSTSIGVVYLVISTHRQRFSSAVCLCVKTSQNQQIKTLL
jgi:hypothetical protein